MTTGPLNGEVVVHVQQQQQQQQLKNYLPYTLSQLNNGRTHTHTHIPNITSTQWQSPTDTTTVV